MEQITLQPTELRIGNWVITPDGKLEQVTRLDGSIHTKSGFYNPALCKGIPLTPDILEKLGFEKELLEKNNPEEGYYYFLRLSDDKYCDLSFISGDKNGFLEVCLFPYSDQFRFQYLHQLQNLYYALTGKELEITL